MKIAVGAFHHETNTFAPARGDLAAFQARDAGGIRVAPPLEKILGLNMGYAGFSESALAYGWTIVPLTFATAVPSNKVTHEAFEHIMGHMLDGLRAAMPVDAVFLDLHGAMVTEDYDSGDAEILRRVRAVIGPAIPLLVEFDYHANIVADTVALADAIFVYRTYPHIDMAELGAKAAHHLRGLISGMPRQAVAFREIDYLIPVPAQSTLAEPMKSAMARIAAVEGQVFGNGRVSTASIAACFPIADVPGCRPSIVAYADTQGAADAAADYLADALRAMEPQAKLDLWTPEAAVAEALRHGDRGTVVLADTQDNPGGGGNGDTVGLLKALIAAKPTKALFAHIWDPELARAAHIAGVGGVLHAGLGAKTGWAGETPVEAEWTVEQLNDGKIVGTGPMAKGWRFNMGPSVRLRHAGVDVLVVSGKGQCLDQEQVRLFGVEAFDYPVLALKSSVHFRADFGPRAVSILVVKSPGPVTADAADLVFKNLKSGLRMTPMGPPFGAQL